MLKFITLFMLVLTPLAFQDEELKRHVVRSYKNGKPYVVVYTIGEAHERVKEELYYESGQLDYVGHYRNGIEHGEWTYYWENGAVKSFEYYFKGKEEGLHFECDSLGKRTKEYYYRKGTLLKEISLD